MTTVSDALPRRKDNDLPLPLPTVISAGVLASAVLVLAPPASALSALAALLVAGSVIAAPIVGLYLLPPFVAFGSLASVSMHGINVGPTDLVVGALAAAWALRRRSTIAAAVVHPTSAVGAALHAIAQAWQRDRGRVAMFGALLAYCTVIAVSGVVATSRPDALKELMKWTEVLVVVACAVWLLRPALRLRAVLWVALVTGVAEAVLGFLQWAVPPSGPGAPADGLRAVGTFSQPNPYAGYLNFALPIALAIVLFTQSARIRWLALGCAALLLGGLALADSRGALLGIAAAVGVTVIVGFRKERLAALVAAIVLPLAGVLAVAGLLPSSLAQKALSAFRVDNISLHAQVTAANFSTMERLAHWVAGLRMLRAHPVLGVGAGNYGAQYPHYAVDPVVWHDSLGHAHNYYINAAAETGIIGLVAFCAVMVVALWLGWYTARRPAASKQQEVTCTPGSPTTPAPVYALGLLAALAALAVHNFTDDLFVHAMELQFALYVGCLLVLARRTPHAP